MFLGEISTLETKFEVIPSKSLEISLIGTFDLQMLNSLENIETYLLNVLSEAQNLTLCGTRKLQFFYAEILPELKNIPMPKTIIATCEKIIKVKNLFENSGIYFSS